MECRCLPDGAWREVDTAACALVLDASPEPSGAGCRPHVLVAVAGMEARQKLFEPEITIRLRTRSRPLPGPEAVRELAAGTAVLACHAGSWYDARVVGVSPAGQERQRQQQRQGSGALPGRVPSLQLKLEDESSPVGDVASGPGDANVLPAGCSSAADEPAGPSPFSVVVRWCLPPNVDRSLAPAEPTAQLTDPAGQVWLVQAAGADGSGLPTVAQEWRSRLRGRAQPRPLSRPPSPAVAAMHAAATPGGAAGLKTEPAEATMGSESASCRQCAIASGGDGLAMAVAAAPAAGCGAGQQRPCAGTAADGSTDTAPHEAPQPQPQQHEQAAHAAVGTSSRTTQGPYASPVADGPATNMAGEPLPGGNPAGAGAPAADPQAQAPATSMDVDEGAGAPLPSPPLPPPSAAATGSAGPAQDAKGAAASANPAARQQQQPALGARQATPPPSSATAPGACQAQPAGSTGRLFDLPDNLPPPQAPPTLLAPGDRLAPPPLPPPPPAGVPDPNDRCITMLRASDYGLPQGWYVWSKVRGGGKEAGKRRDHYFLSPDNRRFDSMIKAKEYLVKLETGYMPTNSQPGSRSTTPVPMQQGSSGGGAAVGPPHAPGVAGLLPPYGNRPGSAGPAIGGGAWPQQAPGVASGNALLQRAGSGALPATGLTRGSLPRNASTLSLKGAPVGSAGTRAASLAASERLGAEATSPGASDDGASGAADVEMADADAPHLDMFVGLDTLAAAAAQLAAFGSPAGARAPPPGSGLRVPAGPPQGQVQGGPLAQPRWPAPGTSQAPGRPGGVAPAAPGAAGGRSGEDGMLANLRLDLQISMSLSELVHLATMLNPLTRNDPNFNPLNFELSSGSRRSLAAAVLRAMQQHQAQAAPRYPMLDTALKAVADLLSFGGAAVAAAAAQPAAQPPAGAPAAPQPPPAAAAAAQPPQAPHPPAAPEAQQSAQQPPAAVAASTAAAQAVGGPAPPDLHPSKAPLVSSGAVDGGGVAPAAVQPHQPLAAAERAHAPAPGPGSSAGRQLDLAADSTPAAGSSHGTSLAKGSASMALPASGQPPSAAAAMTHAIVMTQPCSSGSSIRHHPSQHQQQAAGLSHPAPHHITLPVLVASPQPVQLHMGLHMGIQRMAGRPPSPPSLAAAKPAQHVPAPYTLQLDSSGVGGGAPMPHFGRHHTPAATAPSRAPPQLLNSLPPSAPAHTSVPAATATAPPVPSTDGNINVVQPAGQKRKEPAAAASGDAPAAVAPFLQQAPGSRPSASSLASVGLGLIQGILGAGGTGRGSPSLQQQQQGRQASPRLPQDGEPPHKRHRASEPAAAREGGAAAPPWQHALPNGAGGKAQPAAAAPARPALAAAEEAPPAAAPVGMGRQQDAHAPQQQAINAGRQALPDGAADPPGAPPRSPQGSLAGRQEGGSAPAALDAPQGGAQQLGSGVRAAPAAGGGGAPTKIRLKVRMPGSGAGGVHAPSSREQLPTSAAL